MTSAEHVIRWSTAGAVLGVAAVAAAASYEHAYKLVRAHGEAGWTAQLVPLTVDGLIYASSMVMLDSAQRRMPVPGLARWLLGLGIAATLAANVAHGLGYGLVGAAVSAWSAVALVGSYELLMMIRASQSASDAVPATAGVLDPLCGDAAGAFADELAADRVPSIRAIRLRPHVGQPRAQRLRDYLAAGTRDRPDVSLRKELAVTAAETQAERSASNRLGARVVDADQAALFFDGIGWPTTRRAVWTAASPRAARSWWWPYRGREIRVALGWAVAESRRGGLSPARSRRWPQLVFTPGVHPMRAAVDPLL
jgi:hypothetical protein